MKKSVRILLMATFLLSILSFVQLPKIPAQSISPPDAAPNDVDVSFMVYPDGQVVIGGAFRQDTDALGGYVDPATHGMISFTETNGKTIVSTSFTFVVPPENATEFPFNSTIVDASGEFVNDLLDADINVTVVLPPVYASQFPFNVTDFTLIDEHSNNQSIGTITFDILSGFLLDDLRIDYVANLTDAHYNGSITILYGVPYMDLQIDNATQLQMMLDYVNTTITGQGNGSLYNLTGGLLEATRLDYTTTQFTGGATVDFELYLTGDVMQSIVALIQNSLPMGFTETAILHYFIESSSSQIAYSRVQNEMSIKMTATTNVGALMEYLVSIIPDILPPETAEPIDLLLNATFFSVESGEFSLSYAEGTGEITGTVTIGNDPSAVIDYMKSLIFEQLPPLESWQTQFINETEIDISNLTVRFGVSETSVTTSFEGLSVLPPIDSVNATSFKLERFFNLSEGSSFPGEGEKLGVIVIGGSNSTHKIVLHVEGGLPEPDNYLVDAENRQVLAIWNNVTLNDLKDLQFVIVEGVQAGGVIVNPEAITEDNPFVIDATENLGFLISLSEVSAELSVVVSNVTQPEGVDPPLGTFKLVGNYLQITVSNESVEVNATIRMYYTPEQIEGLDENSLTLYYWDADAGDWVAVPSHVNTEEKYVWAVVDHFSLWALLGSSPSPFWMQWWFIPTIVAVVAVVIVAGILVIKRRKPATEPSLT